MPAAYPTTFRGSLALGGRVVTASGFRSAVTPAMVRSANMNLAAAAGRIAAANENLLAARALGVARAARPLAGLLEFLPWVAIPVGLGLSAWALYELYKWYRASDPLVPASQVLSAPDFYDLPFYPASSPPVFLGGWRLAQSVNNAAPSLPAVFGSLGGGVVGFDFNWPHTFELANPIAVWPLDSAYEFTAYSDAGVVPTSRYVRNVFLRPVAGAYPAILPNASPASVPLIPPFPSSVVVSDDPLLYTIDPNSKPVISPLSVPTSLPYWLIPYVGENPFRVPEYQRAAGYSPFYAPKLAPYEVPLIAPPIVVASSPAAFAARPIASSHVLQPPSGGDRERKVKTPAYAGFALVANGFTESVDALEAVYDALPRRFRSPGKPTIQSMLSDLYLHWDELDAVAAVENLIIENLKDRVYGSLGQKVARSYRQLPERFRPRGKSRFGHAVGPAI